MGQELLLPTEGVAVPDGQMVLEARRTISCLRNCLARMRERIGLGMTEDLIVGPPGTDSLGMWRFAGPVWETTFIPTLFGVDVTKDVTSWAKTTYEVVADVMIHRPDLSEIIDALEATHEIPKVSDDEFKTLHEKEQKAYHVSVLKHAGKLGLDSGYVWMEGEAMSVCGPSMRFFIAAPPPSFKPMLRNIHIFERNAFIGLTFLDKWDQDALKRSASLFTIFRENPMNKMKFLQWFLQGVASADYIEPITGGFSSPDFDDCL